MAAAAIKTEGLTKRYENFTAVDHLDLEIAPGEIFGLLGPNGAGKTTTILMLLGLSEPAEGAASVLGFDPTRSPLEIKRLVGYVPDNVGFYSDMTGRQNLRYTARLNSMNELTSEAKVETALGQVGLTDAADSPAGTYSRGMRQRLGIADALVKDPKILILDEPTIGIDPEGVREIIGIIEKLSREQDVTVLLSSHLLHQIQSICDRVGIFVAGRMVVEGPVRELAARHTPADQVTIEIAVSDWQAAGEALQQISGVTRIDREEDYWVVVATRDVRGEVAAEFARRGVALLHLRRREQGLDEIYARYFESQAEGGKNGSGG
jgi:ABC-2 type transport system ATP-binding protein